MVTVLSVKVGDRSEWGTEEGLTAAEDYLSFYVFPTMLLLLWPVMYLWPCCYGFTANITIRTELYRWYLSFACGKAAEYRDLEIEIQIGRSTKAH